jgi:hypothetical protein
VQTGVELFASCAPLRVVSIRHTTREEAQVVYVNFLTARSSYVTCDYNIVVRCDYYLRSNRDDRLNYVHKIKMVSQLH